MKLDNHQINNSLASIKLTPETMKETITCKQVLHLKSTIEENSNEIFFLASYSTRSESYISVLLYNNIKNTIEQKHIININSEVKKFMQKNTCVYNDIDQISVIYDNNSTQNNDKESIKEQKVYLLLNMFNYKELEYNLLCFDLIISKSKSIGEKLFSVKGIKKLLKSKSVISFDLIQESNFNIVMGTSNSIFTLNVNEYMSISKDKDNQESIDDNNNNNNNNNGELNTLNHLNLILDFELNTNKTPLKVCIASNVFNNKQAAYGNDSRLIIVNLDEKTIIAENELAHINGLIKVKFNHLKPFTIATTGFDSSIKFWDTRNLAEPVYVISNNPHWTLDFAFHNTYNRVLLSSMSSSLVRLVIFDQNDEFEIKTSMLNKVDYLEFDDSVHSICWAENDQWIFAAVSYNGFIHINKIPDDIKFKIMID